MAESCPNCQKWERQAKANCETVYRQAEVIKGLKLAIQEIIKAMKER